MLSLERALQSPGMLLNTFVVLGQKVNDRWSTGRLRAGLEMKIPVVTATSHFAPPPSLQDFFRNRIK